MLKEFKQFLLRGNVVDLRNYFVFWFDNKII